MTKPASPRRLCPATPAAGPQASPSGLAALGGTAGTPNQCSTHPLCSPYLHLLARSRGASSQDPMKSERLGHFPPSSARRTSAGGAQGSHRAAPGKAAPGKALRRRSCPRAERPYAASRMSHKRTDDARGRCNVWSGRLPNSDNSLWSVLTGSFKGFMNWPDVGGSLSSLPDIKFLLQNKKRLMLLYEKPPESFSTRVKPYFSIPILANFLLQKVSRKKKKNWDRR